MDNLQYLHKDKLDDVLNASFKPYYKWIIFNISITDLSAGNRNAFSFKPYYKWIIFNIKPYWHYYHYIHLLRFKPYYKWIIFNILGWNLFRNITERFKPYYKWIIFNILSRDITTDLPLLVLNLIING